MRFQRDERDHARQPAPQPPSTCWTSPRPPRARPVAALGGRARACRLPGGPDAPPAVAGAGGALGRRHRAAAGRSGPSSIWPSRSSGSTAEVEQLSADGTRKYLWRLADGEAIESVLIPSRRPPDALYLVAGGLRAAVRVLRHRPAWDTAGTSRLRDRRAGARDRAARPADLPTNIVFMGMGEPLLNWPAVDARSRSSTRREGFGIGARHITVSTVGILPGIAALARRPEQFRLAISLHAPTSAQRLAIMPIEKKYDLEAVLRAAAAFRKRVTFEYVMIGGVNDRDADADRLAKLARRLGRARQHPAAAPGRRARSHARAPRTGSGRSRPAAQSGDRGDRPAEPRTRHRRGVRTAAGERTERKASCGAGRAGKRAFAQRTA